jgi:ATPase family associated with various cellular activities (AAA)
MTNAEHKAKTGNSLGVNHLDGNVNNWADGNLKVECYWCHNATDSARRARTKAPIVAIVGLPGTGKSAVAEQVATKLRATVYRIDDFRARDAEDAWSRMVAAIQATAGPVVAESNIIPPGYRRLLNERPSTIVRLVADAMTREQRLIARGDHPNRVAKYVQTTEPRLQVNVTVDTSSITAGESGRLVLDAIRRRGRA